MTGLPQPRLVLASASPRRRELLLQGGFRFTVRSVDADEAASPGEDAIRLALRLARAKAEAAACAGSSREEVLLGADTVVVAPCGELLGKPVDHADAVRMLRLLAGATHRVVTGVCVHSVSQAAATPARTETAAAVTYVTFATLSDEEIAAYIATGEPNGKAGAYAIQGRAALWTSRIVGDYTNVVGLPLALTASILETFSIFPAHLIL